MFNNVITLNLKNKIDLIIKNNLIKSKNIKDSNLNIKIAMFLCKKSIEELFDKDNYVYLTKDEIVSYNKQNIAILKNNTSYKYRNMHFKYILNSEIIQTKNFYLRQLRNIKIDSKTQTINPYNIKEKFIENYDKNTIKLNFSIPRTFYINKHFFSDLIFSFKLLDEGFHIEYGNLFCPLIFKSESLTYIFNGVE